MASSVASHGSISVADADSRLQRLSPEVSSQGASPDLPSRRNSSHCCFCWCCSCSRRLPTKRPTDCPPKEIRMSNLKQKQPNAPTITLPLDEVKLWKESFEIIMRSSAGRQIFREFLQYEYSEENILFWLACEDFREIDNPLAREERARCIYEDYISVLSPKEVSLDSQVREQINSNICSPARELFDEAQLQIYTLMQRDSYPRFLASSIYRRILE